MGRFSSRRGILLVVVAFVVAAVGAARTFAQANGGWNGYQRHAGDGDRRDDRHDRRDDRRDRRDFRRNFPMIVSPQVSSAWFQRPYPYHLDYYKMRYGGSYAPYFGNLYGPSVYPAYYGPYYGGYGGGYGGEYGNGYGPAGYGGVPMAYPPDDCVTAPGVVVEKSESANPPLDSTLGSGHQPAAGSTSGVALPMPALK